MSTSIETLKEQNWRETAARLAQVTDKPGKGIDVGILETVVACNVLDLPTIASCEGHLEWGTRAPWVDIASQHPETRISIAALTSEVMQERDRGEKTPAEIAALFEEVHRKRRAVKVHHIEVRQKLLAYLARFYQGRDVPYNQRLIVRPLGTDGKSRLESQGADCQEVLAQEERERNLRAYQAEMQAFTLFLKEIYFTAPSLFFTSENYQ